MSACSSDVVRFSPCHDGLCREALHIEVSAAAAAAVEASNYEKVARAAVETSSSRYYSLALLSGEGRRCRTLDAMRTRSAATTGLIIQCSAASRSCSSPIVTSHCANNQTPFSIVGSHQSTSQPRLTNRGPVVRRLIQPCRAGPHREALHIIHRGSIVLLAAAETSNYGKVAHSSR